MPTTLFLTNLSQRHIVKLLASRNDPSPQLELEYLCGGSLRDQLKARKYFTGKKCVMIAQQTIAGIAYLHSLEPPITHRDISDGNILIERRDADGIIVKLGDFGLSKEGPNLTTIVGTPLFLPPEFFDDNRAPGMFRTAERYTKAVDVWALGAVISLLRCGFPERTRDHDDNPKLWCRDVLTRVVFYHKKTRDSLSYFVAERMLCMSPANRWNSQVILEHSEQFTASPKT